MLESHFVIFHVVVGDINRGVLVRYIYYILFIIYIYYILYTRTEQKMTIWQSDNLTFFVMVEKWMPHWQMDDFNKDWWMTSVKTNKWHSYRCVCARISFVRVCECHLFVFAKMKKRCLRNKKKSHFYWQTHHQSPEGTMRPQAGGGVSGANGTPADGVQPLPKPRRGDRLFRHPSTFWVCHSFGVPFGVFHISRGSVLSGLHRLPVVFRPFGTLVVRLRIVVKKCLRNKKKSHFYWQPRPYYSNFALFFMFNP